MDAIRFERCISHTIAISIMNGSGIIAVVLILMLIPLNKCFNRKFLHRRTWYRHLKFDRFNESDNRWNSKQRLGFRSNQTIVLPFSCNGRRKKTIFIGRMNICQNIFQFDTRNKYVREKCNGSENGTYFWPFFSLKVVQGFNLLFQLRRDGLLQRIKAQFRRSTKTNESS